MSTLQLDTLSIPAADLGEHNPLPPLRSGTDAHAAADISGVDPEMTANMRYGRLTSVLPYTMQDRYGRDRRDTGLQVAVLQNDILRATFLLDFGGRMWSLLHRPTGRELLHRNEILQPANLALRNAWFAGGVEWNIGATGHTPLTCAPLHAARLSTAQGIPVLRMYEWERIREVVYALDFWLPDGSPVLFARVTITNPNDQDVPMYWWSNIAVPETDGLRVLAPAESAYQFGYGRAVHRIPVPVHDGTDVTYPARQTRASDVFFDVSAARRPWIAALDGDGVGLMQTSTPRLGGRKLFVWGRGRGGRRWQEFLSGPNGSYCEIQAGLARTQLERLRMPGNSSWSWLETYGLLQADPALVHGADWVSACRAVERALEPLLPAAALDTVDTDTADWMDLPPAEILHSGSGWGALEIRRRSACQEQPLALPGTPFPDQTLGPDQQPWLQLLDSETLPDGAPVSYVSGRGWRTLLENAPDGPQIWLHRGVARWQADRRDDARTAWQQAPDSWLALRNRGITSEDAATAAELLLAAHVANPGLLPLSIETLHCLLRADRAGDALVLIDNEFGSCADGRIRVAEIEAALATGDLDRVGRVFDSGVVVSDIREGERSLSDLWLAYRYACAERDLGHSLGDEDRDRIRREYPVPRQYDFRA